MAKKSGEKLEEIKLRFNKQAVDENARKAVALFDQDKWHNHFHIDAPYSLISDPNGLCYCDGVYHIYCQWNPVPQNKNWHKNKSWMHVKTRDFINYSYPELSLWPGDEYDKDGCHSGCGFVEDGKVRVFYTANARDENYVRSVVQRYGTLQEDGSVVKEEIIVRGNPEGYTAHFRDPNFFYRRGKRYFAMAAQRMSDYPAKSSRPTNGTTLIYRETDKHNEFELLGEVKTDYYDFGYMWECPNLLRFDDTDVLIVCPQGVPHQEYKYQNHCLAGYFVGHFSVDSLEMIPSVFQELDRGFDFYSPQVFNDGKRQILVGWIGMPDLTDTVASADEGEWLYCLTMPRELTLKQGHIYSAPVKEIENLRKDCKAVDAANVKEFSEQLGDGTESDLTIKFGDAQKVEVALNYGEEKFTLSYDRATQTMIIDRNGMKLGGKGIRPFSDGKNTDVNIGTRKFKLYADETLKLRMFVDHSALEIFMQDGEEVASSLIYPEKTVQPKLEICADKPIEKISGNIWTLGKLNYA